jgi:hypothetical protein
VVKMLAFPSSSSPFLLLILVDALLFDSYDELSRPSFVLGLINENIYIERELLVLGRCSPSVIYA